MIKSFNEFIEEGVFRNSIIRTSGTGTKRREEQMDYIPVDLGLPSGTLWCDRNVLATSPEDFGGYFQWGGTEDMTGKHCDWDVYPYGENFRSFSKYVTDGKYGDIDFKTELDLDDDVAHVKMGGDWRMPTKEQFEELLSNTKQESTKLKGVKGVLFTSKKDSSKFIFVPADGYVYFGYNEKRDEDVYLWSLSRDPKDNVVAACLHNDIKCEYFIRALGASVRGVINKK